MMLNLLGVHLSLLIASTHFFFIRGSPGKVTPPLFEHLGTEQHVGMVLVECLK